MHHSDRGGQYLSIRYAKRLADAGVDAANHSWAVHIHEVLVKNFIASFETPPEELILDFDATDDPVHGIQVGRFFHGYYGHHCFLPLYVFCGEQLLVSQLRVSKIDAAKHCGAILKVLVDRLRREWPDVRIILRADSGFCRHKVLNWCERNDVGYIVGLAKERADRQACGAVHTVSRSSSAICSPTAPVATNGGPISSACCFQASRTH